MDNYHSSNCDSYFWSKESPRYCKYLLVGQLQNTKRLKLKRKMNSIGLGIYQQAVYKMIEKNSKQ